MVLLASLAARGEQSGVTGPVGYTGDIPVAIDPLNIRKLIIGYVDILKYAVAVDKSEVNVVSADDHARTIDVVELGTARRSLRMIHGRVDAVCKCEAAELA